MRSSKKRQRRAIATVITSAIMMSAVCILGSAGAVWSQSSFAVQQKDMTDTAENYVNKLSESLVFEYVYCASNPCDQINVIVTNIGEIGVDVTEVVFSEKTTGFNKIHVVSNGQIMPDHSISIPVSDAGFASTNILDVMIKTNRGNIIQTQTSI